MLAYMVWEKVEPKLMNLARVLSVSWIEFTDVNLQ